MEVDLAAVEVVFAQKLACGEPVTRQRALRVLHDWIREQSSKKPFNEEDLMRLCKGLHYVMWMQDKMLLQEELADKIGGLINIFGSEEEKILYVKCFLKSISKEWPHIDRWRMDKFLMEIRRMLKFTFAHLRELNWKKEIRDKYWAVFEETTISADKNFSEGLKFHFASLFLDELDNAGGLTAKQVSLLLKPYANLLGNRRISDYLFSSIITEIFMTILHQKSEEIAAKAENEGDEPMEEGGIQFNYKNIGEILFNVGKKSEIPVKRRKRIYDLVKKFEQAAAGRDPLHFEPPVPSEVLTKAMFEEAEERVLKINEEIKNERKKCKQMKVVERQKQRQREEAHEENDEQDSGDENPTPLKKLKKSSSESIPKVKKAKKSKKIAVKGLGKKVLKQKKPMKAKK
ncbi:unnamed protein product [Caenorhabditis bovis]|uniref:Uncharacterized protein n=1 Tax=Caenorhabditis bovis TaxID=2654633 RepID=A0A8S1F3K8_9PELO|nr:unnamed protein product [Caenorhabditis bovis]